VRNPGWELGIRRLPLKLRAFIDFVTPRLRNRLNVAAL
jgi:hypothetical protein